MRRIYRSFVQRRALLVKRAKVAIAEVETREYVVAAAGFLTFFFGFAAGAVLNLYLLAIGHPLVAQLRSTLSYKSAIIGDGLVLPIVNMIAAHFILKNTQRITKKTIQLALVSGGVVTLWFHVNQAVQGLVNWAMPTPWHWNFLGLWHGLYMFSVASLLSLFALTVVKVVKEEREIPKEAVFVTVGLTVFFILLRLDYISINLSSLLRF